MNPSRRMTLAGALLGCTLCLASCGGGDSGSSGGGDSGGSSSTSEQRAQAASTTAQTNANCVAIQPFYWEIGNADGPLANGGSPTDESSYTRDTTMLIASASKWWFGAYVAELHGGQLTAADLQATRMLSGYTSLTYASCLRPTASQAAETVSQCLQTGSNGSYTAANDGLFYYNGGHFQQQAVALGLGDDNRAQLAAAIGAELGAELGIAYDSPQLAAGGIASAASYASFLQKLLHGDLALSKLLGSNAVCTRTSDGSCPTSAYTPIPSSESWHYSIGHWVEDDPQVGDGAFSSPGAFGFYPWISADRKLYGILARHEDSSGAYVVSVNCGRLIRKAYQQAVAQ